MKHTSLSDKIYFVLAALIIFSPKAYAYLDPGTGSMVAQILIATFAGAIYAVKLQWKKLLNSFNILLKHNVSKKG
jgi:hypothetical protein